jgi:radical SAM protein with 4Fe4S-binding SPASM domain
MKLIPPKEDKPKMLQQCTHVEMNVEEIMAAYPHFETFHRAQGRLQSFYNLMTGKLQIHDPIYSRRLIYYQLWGAPIFNLIIIQTTSQCNRTCNVCNNELEADNKSTIMSDVIFQKIINELVHINYRGKVSLFQANEPFTDRKLVNRIDYLVEKLPNAFHHMATNGDLATEEKLLRIANKLNRLDLYSYDKEALKRNEKYFTYLKSHSSKAFIDHIDCVHESESMNQGNIKQTQSSPKQKYAFCEHVFQTMMINPSGEALTCCHDLSQVNKLGNVKDESLLEIWYSPQYSYVRENLSKGNRSISGLCEQCNYSGYGGWSYGDVKYDDKGKRQYYPRKLFFSYPEIKKHTWLFEKMSQGDELLIKRPIVQLEKASSQIKKKIRKKVKEKVNV